MKIVPCSAKRLAVTALSLLFLLTPLFVSAQEADRGDEVLEEITVTARKKEVDLQKASVAVSAVSGEDLDQSAVSKLDDFNGYVPNLAIAKNDGAGRVVAIRGVGWETAQSLSTQPGVLVYVDGVYLANPLSMGLDLGEIEQVEVLRGPQGTEFGQSAIGGAINIITKKAEMGETGGSLDLRAGDYGLFEGRAAVNLSNSEKLAFYASIQKRSHDGFAEIEGGPYDGYELDDADATTAHVNLNWKPTDTLSIKLSGWFQDNDQHGAAQKHLEDPNPDARKLTQDYPSTFALENTSLSAVIHWDLPGARLTSLTGYQKLRKQQTVDGDRLTSELTSVNLTGFYNSNFDILPYWDNNSDAFSQELNLTGGTEKLDWVVGAYYLDHENFNDFLEAVAPGTPADYQEQLDNPGPDTLPPFTPPLEFVETRTLTREDKALYGQLTWRLNDRYALTMGGRYQEDTAVDEATQFWFSESLQTLEDDTFTWKLGLDIDLNPNHLLYFLASTGWKNGGNSPGALNGALDAKPQFEPEEVTAFEVGSKNVFGQGKIRYNVMAFYYDYENYQFVLEDPVPFAGGANNIPSLTIYGLENEWSVILSDHWRLDGQFSLSDGEIDSDFWTLDTVDFLNSGVGRFLPTSVEDRAALRVNLRGNTPPKLVEESGRLTLSYSRALNSGSIFRTRLDYIYRGEYQYRVFNNPLVDTVPSYNITGLYAEWDFGSLPLTASFSLTNLFDKDGVNSRFSNPYGLHTTSEEFIPPREITARLRYNF